MKTESDIDRAYRSFARKDFQDAADCVRRVLRNSPRDPAALTLTGRLALVKGDPLLAYHSFQHVMGQYPDNSSLWLDMARALRDLGRHHEALAEARRALDRDGSHVESLVLTAEICMGLGEKSGAAELFRQALELDGKCLAAYRGLSMTGDLKPDSTPVQNMVALLDSGRLSVSDSAQVHYALAQVYRHNDCWPEFFEHLFAANKQQRSLSSSGRDEYRAHFDRIEAAFHSEAFDKVTRIPPISPTPIFIVGMPRSGTTLIERIVSGHPDVAAGGEIDFMRSRLRHRFETLTGVHFPLDFEKVPGHELKKMADDFQRRLAIIGPECQYVTDKTPGNFHLLGLLEVLFSGARIIHVNRNPLDTCFSILQFPFDDHSPHTCDVGLLAYVYGRYVRLMAHWKRVLGDKFITVEYESVVSSPSTEGQRIFEYCGLDWREEFLDVSRSGSAIRTFSAIQARQPIYQSSIGIGQRFAQELAPLNAALREELRQG